MRDIEMDFAQALITQGQKLAKDIHLNAVFAVLDKGANLVAFARMDNAWLASNELSIAKARTAVMFQAPTEVLNTPVELGKPMLHFDHIHHGGLVLVGGGVPIVNDAGELIGGFGVSGGTPEQDAGIAHQVLKTICQN